ncbi:MAG TPA: hypothetical protein PKA41_04480 [Verrucomicrobiota bacterium]|nr:hypothetical protein [Verrucomicrobiota bacterium]
MKSPLVHCSKCNTALVDGVFNLPDFTPCPSCEQPLQVEVFPALFRAFAPANAGEAVMTDGEASCFYHPQKKAVLPCDGCGRFLCALCDCAMDDRHYCPSCLEAGRTKGKIKNLQNSRTLYDTIAIWLTIVPVLFFYFTFITAPMALYIAIKHWNTPTSIVRNNKLGYVVAIVLASLQILAWIAVLWMIFTD